MAQNLTKFSTNGLPAGTAIDVASASLNLRRRTVHKVIPTVVANTSTYTGFIVTKTSKVTAVSICWYDTVPAESGGTVTIQVDAVAADGTTVVVIVTLVTILTGQTVNVPLALTLAATNPTTLASGTSIKVTVIASNNTVQTSGAGYGDIAVQLEPIDPDPLLSA